MIDWGLIGITSTIMASAVIIVVSAALGLTRVEKSLIAVLIIGISTTLVTAILHPWMYPDPPEFTTRAETLANLERWSTSYELNFQVMTVLWRLTVAAGTGWLIAAALHIWRDRSNLRDILRPNKSDNSCRGLADGKEDGMEQDSSNVG